MENSEMVILVPCYNEEKRLNKQAFIEFTQKYPSYDICFVNDGSKDCTLDVLRGLCGENNPHLRYLDLPQNGGKAEAIRQGMIRLKDRYNYLGFCDADLATPLEEMVSLKEACGTTYQMVMGSRIKRLGANICRANKRHYAGRFFATAVSTLFNIPVYDSQCGAKVFKKDCIAPLFSNKFESTWLFDVELLVRMKLWDGGYHHILEYPIHSWQEMGGSKIKWDYWFKAPFILLGLYKKYTKQGFNRTVNN